MEDLTLKDFIATALIDVVSAMNEFEDFSDKNAWGATAFPNINQIIAGPKEEFQSENQMVKTEYLLSSHIDNSTGERVESTVVNFNFDIAVTASSNKNERGKAGIKVLQLIEGGIERNADKGMSNASRIQFKVPIALRPYVK